MCTPCSGLHLALCSDLRVLRTLKVQAAIYIRESRTYWLDMAAVLAEQCEARPACQCTCLVHTSQCLHCGKKKLLVKAWQIDPRLQPYHQASATRRGEPRSPHALFKFVLNKLM